MDRMLWFKKERETKGAWLYVEVDRAGNLMKRGTDTLTSFYLRKSALNGSPAPEEISIPLNF